MFIVLVEPLRFTVPNRYSKWYWSNPHVLQFPTTTLSGTCRTLTFYRSQPLFYVVLIEPSRFTIPSYYSK